MKFPCFLYNPANVGNLISGFSFFSKPSLAIWNFLVHILLKPSMQHFKHDLISMGDEYNCPLISTFFGTKCPDVTFALLSCEDLHPKWEDL